MRSVKTVLQVIFLLAVLLLLISRAVTAGLSHDENKFVYAGQALADYGLLPYRDYPYDQMPYTALFYAASAKLSSSDFLADRVFGTFVWLGCIIVLLAIVRALVPKEREKPDDGIPVRALLVQLVVVLIFVLDPQSLYVQSAVKNNSFATLFALLGFLFFVLGVKRSIRLPAAAFWSGFFVSLAGCSRLNYFVLFFVLAALWLLLALTTDAGSWMKLLGWSAGGALVGALPLLALVASAPAEFYYANIVQIRLTTLYYEGMLSRENMDLASKLGTFARSMLHDPVNLVLYILLIIATGIFVRSFIRRRSSSALIGLAASAFAGALLMTAFMASPMEDHYLFAPLPFLLIILALSAGMFLQQARWAFAAALIVPIAFLAVSSTAADIPTVPAKLLHPGSWPPTQIHTMAQNLLGEQHIPAGRILTLLPMVPAETGYQAYPFTASGSNSWRTSLLLTAERRSLYKVTSPEELAAVLDAAPPVAILTGIETANAGFTFRDQGGLEDPFISYAEQHGYKPIQVQSGFYGHLLTLWVREH